MATSHFPDLMAECPNCQSILNNFIYLHNQGLYWTKCGRCGKKYEYSSWINELREVKK